MDNKKDFKKIQKMLFEIGTFLEVITVFVYAIFRKDIIIYIGFPLSILLIFLGNFHKKTTQEKKLEQIELHDERNIIIRDKAQSKTNLVMVYIALMTIIILAITGHYTSSVIVSIAVVVDSLLIRYFTSYYNKRL